MPAPPPAQADIWHALVTADAAALSALRLSNSCGSPSRSSIPKNELAAAVELAAGTFQMPREFSALRRYLIDLLLDLSLATPGRPMRSVRVSLSTAPTLPVILGEAPHRGRGAVVTVGRVIVPALPGGRVAGRVGTCDGAATAPLRCGAIAPGWPVG